MQPLGRWLGRAFLPCTAIVTIAALMQHAQAQLSSAQQSALRSNCQSDFMSHCPGVTPGSKETLACLQKNVASLSPGCQAAVKSTLPPPPAAAKASPPPKPATVAPKPKPATAAAPPPKAAPSRITAAQKDAMRASCRGDYMSHCASVPPGGAEALACLRRNAGQLSAACKRVIGGTRASASPSQPVHAAPPPAVAQPAAAGPTPQQLKALKFTCRRDFRVHCGGVPADGQQAFACLMRNSARLTPDCKTSVRAIQQSAPVQPASTSAAMPLAPPPAPPKQQATVVDVAVMARACKLDMFRHCRNTDPGGGRMLQCLLAHEAALSMPCRTALNVTSPLR